MISGTHTVEIGTSPEFLWDYLDDFDNWAQFVVGFQSFRRVDERTSVWTLRGDVGVLAREVELEVTLLEQEPGRRARYSITGITERLDGTGTFVIVPVEAAVASGVGAGPGDADEAVGDVPPEDPAASSTVPAQRQGWWRRLVRRLVLAVLRRQHARSARSRAAESTSTPPSNPTVQLSAPMQVSTGGPNAVLTFSLEVSAGGPMAPMIEMLMRPLLEPSAEDFSTRVREQLEGTAHA